jgi:hypothetical protein
MTATPDTATPLMHYHVAESTVGCLPEADPYLTSDPGLALDILAQMLASWGESDACDQDAGRAAELAGLCQADPERGECPEHDDALTRLTRGQGICHTVGLREFEIQACPERDCLKYCPAGDCRTVTSVNDTDPWCWCCGKTYVPPDACPWLE